MRLWADFSSENRRICLVFSGSFTGKAETREIPRPETDYSIADCGQIEKGVAAFIEMLQRIGGNGRGRIVNPS